MRARISVDTQYTHNCMFVYLFLFSIDTLFITEANVHFNGKAN